MVPRLKKYALFSIDHMHDLMKYGFLQLNAKRKDGWTPLHAAAQQATSICRLLLNSGAEVNEKSEAMWTPLHIAARHQGPDVCQVLLDAGADVNVKGMNGNTPIHLASRMGKLSTVKLLVERNADVSAKNDLGLTALQLAQYNSDHASLVEYWLNYYELCGEKVPNDEMPTHQNMTESDNNVDLPVGKL